jgi:hypothetical protein
MDVTNVTNGRTIQYKNDKQTGSLLMLAIGIIAIGFLCLFIEILNNKMGTGLFISCFIIVCGLSLYSLLILFITYNKKLTGTSNNVIRILLTINSLINVTALVYFIIIFTSKRSDLMKIAVLEYIKPYLKAFLYTIVVIVIVNIFIYHYLNHINITMKNVIPLIIFLSVFGLVECIIEIIFLNIISKILNNTTDG